MAPRVLETPAQFAARLKKAAKQGQRVVPFGGHHFTHAACQEGGVWRLREWVLDPAKGDAYLAEHGTFMPEHAEMLSEPGPQVLLEAATLDAFISRLLAAWPLDAQGGPVASSAGSSDHAVAHDSAARIRAEERAETELKRGSRVARGCAALVSGFAAGVFWLAAIGLLMGGRDDALPFAVLFAVFASPLTFLTARWLRGLPPHPVDVDEAAVREAARKALDERPR